MKMKKPHQIGTNVASEGSAAYELSMDYRFGEATEDIVKLEQPDTMESNDGLMRVQNAFCNIL